MKPFPLRFGKPLRVVCPRQPTMDRQDHRGGDDRTGQRTSSCFVDTGDPPIPASPGFLLELLGGSHQTLPEEALCLRQPTIPQGGRLRGG
jgi:hypothetical protein